MSRPIPLIRRRHRRWRPAYPVGAVLAVVALVSGCGSATALPQGDPVAGEAIVESLNPTCGQCHLLESAGFTGNSAPDLDALRPGYQRVLDAVRTGPGFMPSYAGVLSEAELQSVAAYVSGEAAR